MARISAPHTIDQVAAPSCCGSLTDAALTTAQAESLAHAFAALADPVRLRLLSLIATSAGGEVCACDVVEPLGKSQPTVSHHLKVLREAGLVTADKRGIWMWYRAVPERIAELRGALA
ncbi:MAG: metalloregulator ArsR/SmtB family transcription factor [Actinomycetota bacterium]|nr:metalloregulator ArsR/SmtB family transcription factor [Actinomycetota bacterium]